MAYTLVNQNDPTIENFRGAFLKIRRALGVTAFGINEVRLPAGARGVEHDEQETGHDEVYVVVDGSGVFRIDDDQVPVTNGDYLRVDATSTRRSPPGIRGCGSSWSAPNRKLRTTAAHRCSTSRWREPAAPARR
jgi:Cupin domain